MFRDGLKLQKGSVQKYKANPTANDKTSTITTRKACSA